MAKKKEQRLAAGVLWMLAAGVLGCPLTASAAEEAQTSKTEPLWQESMGSGAQEEPAQTPPAPAQGVNAGTAQTAQTPAQSGHAGANTTADYTLENITVEARRPKWEETLSPGTVTVIRPEEFKGEQKTLPDFLKMVPGVHVREVQGKGQYTTVTVRGSTAAQVGVFVDGVLTNLGGDAAVDISTIPVSNVERIEVYRGYIPARFAGTFIGGVINVVTKKPKQAHGSAEVGPASFGGKKASVEITAPLGPGSLLFGLNHESRKVTSPIAAMRRISSIRIPEMDG